VFRLGLGGGGVNGTHLSGLKLLHPPVSVLAAIHSHAHPQAVREIDDGIPSPTSFHNGAMRAYQKSTVKRSPAMSVTVRTALCTVVHSTQSSDGCSVDRGKAVWSVRPGDEPWEPVVCYG
jgi:hypothetical protein